jgi:hypothetical protein
VTGVRLTLALIVAVGAWRPALAQLPPDPPVHRFEASIGGMWLTGAALGAGDAELRRNSLPADEFALFSADTRMEASPGFDARVAFWLTRSLALEAGAVVLRPMVQTSVSGDIEEVDDLTLEEQVDQYFIEGSAVLLLERFRIGERTIPFVSGGAGYLRQLHEGQTLVESGQVYHVGGGIRHWLRLRDTGFLRAAGLRADARAYFLVNGFSIEDRARPHGAVSGSVFLTF